jgi:hypothetical protein
MELNNKSLAVFLLAAVVVSIGGTILSLNRMGSIHYTTGYASTDYGTATLFINSSTEIYFSIDSIDWGSGFVNSTSGAEMNCTLNTNNYKSIGCIGFTQNNIGLELTNDGNTIPQVRLWSNAGGIDMFGDYTLEDPDYGNSQLKYKVSDAAPGSCQSEYDPIEYTDVNTTNPGTLICDGMNFHDNDTIRIDVLVNFIYLTSTGEKEAVFTAQAT